MVFVSKDLLNPALSYDAQGNPIRISDKVAQYGNPTGWANMAVNQNETEANSFLADGADSMVQSLSHNIGSKALERLGVPSFLTVGVNAFGSEIESAYRQGATFGEATASGLTSAAAEIVWEKLSGVFKFKGVAFDEGLQRALKTGIENKFLRTFLKFGIDAVGEGAEEVQAEDELCRQTGRTLCGSAGRR